MQPSPYPVPWSSALIVWNFSQLDQAIAIRVTLACILAAALGLERSLRGRAAGLRTHLAVALGAALFTAVGAFGFGHVAGPDRVAGQVVTGIGFLGAGTIWRHGTSVEGLTTAASLWVAAAIGVACGAGMVSEAVLTTALMLGALEILGYAERALIEPVAANLESDSGAPSGSD